MLALTMTNSDPLQISQMLLGVDAARAADDPFKLPTYLSALVTARRLAYLISLTASTQSVGTKTGATSDKQVAYKQLDKLLHDEYNFLNGLPSYQINAAQKKSLLESYGWDKGNIGEFDQPRILSLALLAPQISTNQPANRKLPSDLLDLMAAQVAIVYDTSSLSAGGTKEGDIQEKNADLEALEIVNSRARFYYCSASDETQYSKELARVGFQPKRMPGEVEREDNNDSEPDASPVDAS